MANDAQSDLAGLSRYLFGVPRWYASVGIALVVAGLVGLFAFDSTHPLRAAWQGVFFVGVPTLVAGGATTPIDHALGGELTVARSAFLALVGEFFVVVFLLVAGVIAVGTGFGQEFVFDALLAGLAVVFAIRVVVELAVSRPPPLRAVLPASVHTLVAAVFLVIYSGTLVSLSVGGPFAVTYLSRPGKAPPGLLSVGPEDFVLLGVLSVLYVGIAVGLLAVVDRPVRNSLGVSSLDFVHGLIAHVAGSAAELEAFFEEIGQDALVPVSVLSFRRTDGTEKARFIVAMIHPGPMGEVGGGNFPERAAETTDALVFPPHATAGHDFNVVSKREVDRLVNSSQEIAGEIEYAAEATQSVRASAADATVLGQAFGDDAFLVSSFAPAFADDIHYGVGLTAIAEARAAGLDTALLADAHNSNDGFAGPEMGHVTPGSPRADTLIHAAGDAGDRLSNAGRYPVSMGVAWEPTEWTPKEGIGPLGIRVAVVSVQHRRTAYVLIDGNNVEPGLRDRIVDEVAGVDRIEVMTTDTHIVTAIEPVNQVGARIEQDAVVDVVTRLVADAIADEEPVEAGIATEHATVTVFGDDRTEHFASLASVMVVLGTALFVTGVVAAAAVTVALFWVR